MLQHELHLILYVYFSYRFVYFSIYESVFVFNIKSITTDINFTDVLYPYHIILTILYDEILLLDKQEIYYKFR